MKIIARLSYNTSFGLYDKVDFLTLFTFLTATQNVACFRFLHILTESEQNYFYQNLGTKWPATVTVVNKQLFFDPKLAQTTCLLYNTVGVKDINLKLCKNKLQYILSCTFKMMSFNAAYGIWLYQFLIIAYLFTSLIDYSLYIIITLSASPRLGC